MGQFSAYDWLFGIEQILLLYAFVTVAFVGLMSVQLYRRLQEQDAALARGQASPVGAYVILTVKTAILWVIGYRGEERERTRFVDVDVRWMDRYRTSIIFRFVPAYALYILALLVWTRPVFFDGHSYHTFKYSADLYKLFILFVLYVGSNVFFDYCSLRVTFAHLDLAQKTGRYAYYFTRNLVTVIGLFIPSQIVSCILWVYKREHPSFPDLHGNIVQNFFEETTWPYAFATGHDATQIVSGLFPGQLLITGIVFVPTLLVVSMFVVYYGFLQVTQAAKRLLLSHRLDDLCRAFLRVRLIAIFEPPDKVKGFGLCNLAFLGLLDLSIVTLLGAVASRLI